MHNYAVIGNPIAHSISPQIHHQFAKQVNIQISYERVCAPVDGFANCVANLKKQKFNGANVTAPFKKEAFALCDKVSDEARQARAVNTLVFDRDGSLFGHNTDGIGLARELVQRHKLDLTDKTILIIGSGGAVQGVLHSLLKLKPQSVTLAVRTPSKAQKMLNDIELVASVNCISLEDLGGVSYDLILHATSVRNADDINLPRHILKTTTFCYDLNYKIDGTTPFLLWSQQNGVVSFADGFGMLIEQAAESFYAWEHKLVNTHSILLEDFAD